jgi:hypothetical protein
VTTGPLIATMLVKDGLMTTVKELCWLVITGG